MKTEYRHAAIALLSLLIMGTPSAFATKFIPGDTTIGTWDAGSRIYTLTADVHETIQIDENDMILEGNGHRLTGSDTYGVYFDKRTGVTVRNLTVEGFTYGIYVYSEKWPLYTPCDNVVTDVSVSHCDHGVYLTHSSGNTLANITASYNTHGIHLTYPSAHNILSNNVTSNNDNGIHLQSARNTVADNIASDNDCGIRVYGSSHDTLTNNTASNNETGISLENASQVTLSGNTMSGNTYNFNMYGYSDWTFPISVDTTNTVDGKPVYYLKHVSGQVYDDSTNAGVFCAISCDNITVQELTVSNNANGVYFWNTHNSTVENVTALNNDSGICLVASGNNRVANNTTSNNVNGIRLYDSENNALTGNTANSNDNIGIYLHRHGHYTVLVENTANSNDGNGFHLASSWHIDLRGNTANSNQGHGVRFVRCDHATVTGNSTSENEYGIYFSSSSYGVATENTVSANNFGLRLYVAKDNQIYNNNFIGNATQAFIAGGCSGNIFSLDRPTGGNFWSNWTSPDDDRDGFVDQPYTFYAREDALPWARQNGWAVIQVDIDIKPGSDLNPINPQSQGLVPVAILTTDDFDAAAVNPDTILIASRRVAMRGKANKSMAHLEDVDGDGDIDLLVQIGTDVEDDPWETGRVDLTGETFDGTSIIGYDYVLVVPKEL